jgi:hypothetical protein
MHVYIVLYSVQCSKTLMYTKTTEGGGGRRGEEGVGREGGGRGCEGETKGENGERGKGEK